MTTDRRAVLFLLFLLSPLSPLFPPYRALELYEGSFTVADLGRSALDPPTANS